MKRAVKTKTEIKPKAPNKGTNETTYKRVEETIIIKKKVNPYIDNYSYVETKNILNNNPRFQVIVEHRRKGDIIGGGNFEETKDKSILKEEIVQIYQLKIKNLDQINLK